MFFDSAPHSSSLARIALVSFLRRSPRRRAQNSDAAALGDERLDVTGWHWSIAHNREPASKQAAVEALTLPLVALLAKIGIWPWLNDGPVTDGLSHTRLAPWMEREAEKTTEGKQGRATTLTCMPVQRRAWKESESACHINGRREDLRPRFMPAAAFRFGSAVREHLSANRCRCNDQESSSCRRLSVVDRARSRESSSL